MAERTKGRTKSRAKLAEEPSVQLATLPAIYVKMIFSGGQTGVDRAALEIAFDELHIPYGGWCPHGRLAEDGRIPKRFSELKETASDRYHVRTELNVKESEATLILYKRPMSRGTALTRKYAQRLRKPNLCVLLKRVMPIKEIIKIRTWLQEHKVSILNIAGPRESTAPGIASEAKQLLRQVLHTPRHALPPAVPKKLKPTRRSPAN